MINLFFFFFLVDIIVCFLLQVVDMLATIW